ncbi:sigma-70 family RNA polymerase sigma factor [Streptomyces rochei]|uniref:sigma-70 family RNA polymerase sigma factor n=1 Tax=Streptomyces rochei TaxID=1928 RepID=UPI003637B756
METQVTAALEGDQEATTAILRNLDRLIRARARRIDRQHAEDLAQEGRAALWRSMSRFTGGSTSQFVVFAERTVTGAMMDAYCTMRYPGISVDEAKLWRSAFKHAKGDADEAERLMCSGELAWRMSPATAKAVRAAVSPVEALPEDLGASAPDEPSGGVTGRSTGLVGVVLSTLGKQQRAVLEMTYGIGEYGRMTDAEIAATLGIPKGHVAAARSKALKRLRDKWSGSFLFA